MPNVPELHRSLISLGDAIELSRLRAVMEHDLRASIPQIRLPTLVLGARDDLLTPSPLQEELARLIPVSELRLFANGGHFFPTIHTDTYNAALTAFLDAESVP